MSLYDDDVLSGVGLNLSSTSQSVADASSNADSSKSGTDANKPETNIASWNSNSLKLLQYQVEVARKRQANINASTTAKREKSIVNAVTPVIDLSEKRKPQLQLRKEPETLPYSNVSEVRFNVLTGKIEKEEDSLYATLNEEYDPMKPNDYEKLVRHIKLIAKQQKTDSKDTLKKRKHSRSSSRSRSRSRSRERRRKRSRSRDRRRRRRSSSSSRSRSLSPSRSRSRSGSRSRSRSSENDRRKSKDDEDNRSVRRSNNMFAPPPSLIEQSPSNESNDTTKTAVKSDALFKAEKMMVKMGYREGEGLGKNKQGMSIALQVEKTGLRMGRIIHEKEIAEQLITSAIKEPPMAPPPPITPTVTPQALLNQSASAAVGIPADVMKNMSKVILLRNMVDPGDVDDDLENETKEECQKYGEVNRVIIFEIPKRPQEEAVRIFIEFERLPSAIKALTDLNGRFFGGRKVKANFYDYDKFKRLELGDDA